MGGADALAEMVGETCDMDGMDEKSNSNLLPHLNSPCNILLIPWVDMIILLANKDAAVRSA